MTTVKGQAIAEASFIAYLEYVMRYEIVKMLEAKKLTDPNADIDKVTADLKADFMKHVAADLSENTPKVFNDLGRRLREATK